MSGLFFTALPCGKFDESRAAARSHEPAILLPVGTCLVLGVPHVFPIPLTPDMAAVYGWFFLGSFAYYLYGFWRRSSIRSMAQESA